MNNPEPRPATLYLATGHGLTLTEALGRTELAGAVVLLAAPDSYRVARLEPDGPEGPEGPLDVSSAFDARAFTEEIELRWLRDPSDPDARGRFAVLTEDSMRVDGGTDPIVAVDVIDATGILWGWAAAAENAEGSWTRLEEPRIGSLDIPIQLDSGARAQLRSVEYVAVDDHGNAFVAEERLVCLERAPNSDEAGRS